MVCGTEGQRRGCHPTGGRMRTALDERKDVIPFDISALLVSVRVLESSLHASHFYIAADD